MESLVEKAGFSLTECGPLDHLLARVGLNGSGSQRLLARAFLPALIVWLPLLVMALVLPREGEAVAISFFEDLATHVRFLVVVPLLVLAERGIGRLTGIVASQFVDAGLIGPDERARFDDVVRKFAKALDSTLAEAIIALLAIVLVTLAIGSLTTDGVLFWFEEASAGGERLTAAGWWYVLASLLPPFLFLRWAWRYIVWCGFLRRMSRMNLRIVATHPDRAGGLGFVSLGHAAFAQVGFAASCLVAAAVGTRVLHESAQLASFQWPIAFFIALCMVVGIAPLFVFWRPLRIVKERGLLQYGKFSSYYALEFDRKWIGRNSNDGLMDAADDIGALADLGGSFERVDNMRLLSLVAKNAIAIGMAAAAPMLPLLLTVMPLQELLKLVGRALM